MKRMPGYQGGRLRTELRLDNPVQYPNVIKIKGYIRVKDCKGKVI